MKKILNHRLSLITILFICLFIFSLPLIVSADNVTDNLTTVVNQTDLVKNDNLYEVIGIIVNVLLGFLGVIMVLFIIYGGFIWMTAGGDSGKVDKAKSFIRNAVIGVIIVLAAYAIASFTLSTINKALATVMMTQ